VSNVPKCPLNTGVPIVQKLVKHSNTWTTFSQQVEIALWKWLRVSQQFPIEINKKILILIHH